MMPVNLPEKDGQKKGVREERPQGKINKKSRSTKISTEHRP